jgi:hypothetical protein
MSSEISLLNLWLEIDEMTPCASSLLGELFSNEYEKPFRLILQIEGDESSLVVTTLIKFEEGRRVSESFPSVSKVNSLFAFRKYIFRNAVIKELNIFSRDSEVSNEYLNGLSTFYSDCSCILFNETGKVFPNSDTNGVFRGIENIHSKVLDDKFITMVDFIAEV